MDLAASVPSLYFITYAPALYQGSLGCESSRFIEQTNSSAQSGRLLAGFPVTCNPGASSAAVSTYAERRSRIAYTISLPAFTTGAIVYLERQKQLAGHVRNF